ncbi:MAG TPA: serine hydrolase domain-containing protein [Vicinamibacterales bacterium]|nr:serine hydrolase domain-containing protein [Vicinamibacterales bacterium]
MIDGPPTRRGPPRASLPVTASAALLVAALSTVALPPPRLAAQSDDPMPRALATSVGLNEAALAEATAVLQRHVDAGKTAGAVAMMSRHGRLAYSVTVGSQDLATHAPMNERSLFRIYSMTKPVTAVAVMMLWEQGRFGLDDPVSKYLAEFAEVVVRNADGTTRPPARPVTVRDLLLHTSGLEHRTSAVYRDAQVRSRTMTLPQFVRNIVRVPLMEDPGTRFRYSESTTVLGRLVEVWSGMPFDAFLDARIFGPLRMPDTGFYATPAQQRRLTTVYGPGDNGALREVAIESLPFTEKPALIEGAVGLLSTAPDFLRFAQMLLRHGELDGVRLLEAQTVDTMVRNGLSDPVLAARGNGAMGWGLGNVNIVLKPEALRYPASRGEYGWDGTAGTIFWNDPAADTVLVLLTQNSPPDPDNLRARFKTAIQEAIR